MSSKINIILHSIYFLIIIFIAYHFKNEQDYYQNNIDDLYSKVEELELKLNQEYSVTVEQDTFNSWFYEQKIKLQQEEIDFDKNRRIQEEVFYELIKNTEYENYIIKETYVDFNRPKLTKVMVEISGNDKIINFFQYLSGKSQLLYFKENN